MQSLGEVCEVHKIASPAALSPFPEEASYLILEEHALTEGRWFGALSAQGTSMFHELHQAIIELKRTGSVVVVVVANAPATHMTGSLRSSADLVITNRENEVATAAEEISPVLRAVREYLK
ncbi:hypothetical protein CKJ83_01795 [Corynebacterium hadale]|nr:hypothetical protein CKJ83_01795 [Corynebacterium hadale]